MNGKRVTNLELLKKKRSGEKIAVITAYDYPTARLADAAGVDVILVGDSMGNVVLGYENTLPVTMEDMLSHTAAAVRGSGHAMVVGDMPFMSYQVSCEQAMENAGRLIKQAGANAVKVEGGRAVAESIRRMVDAGIPVMGHLGLTPQSVLQFGGFRVQGRSEEDAGRIIEDAKLLEEAGAFAVVLEVIPQGLAKEITEVLSIPTIGIGAGPYCDGQVQVVHDMLGLYGDNVPKHAKKYLNLSQSIEEAIKNYVSDVRSGEFPGAEHSF
jgi:3-methyl-2-oxobutanoate hydroxymethyltransferase